MESFMHSHTFSSCYSLFCEVPFHSPSLPPVPQCVPGALGSSCSMQSPLTGLPPPAVADQLSHGPCCRRRGEGLTGYALDTWSFTYPSRQPINQSIDQSIDQSINQSINQITHFATTFSRSALAWLRFSTVSWVLCAQKYTHTLNCMWWDPTGDHHCVYIGISYTQCLPECHCTQLIGIGHHQCTPSCPGPKTKSSMDLFQYHYTDNDVHVGWGMGTRLHSSKSTGSSNKKRNDHNH